MTAPLPEPKEERLARQVRFLVEVDRLKEVLRRNYLADGSRVETTAEHSWHAALMALVLAEYAEEPVDRDKVVAMMLVHDIVEVDAGDTFLYDREGQRDKAAREAQAADRLFGLLPPDQGRELRALWEEFEAGETPEARFAKSLDRFAPLTLNVASGGRAWLEHGVRREDVLRANRHTALGSQALWAYMRALVDEAHARGYLGD